MFTGIIFLCTIEFSCSATGIKPSQPSEPEKTSSSIEPNFEIADRWWPPLENVYTPIVLKYGFPGLPFYGSLCSLGFNRLEADGAV